MKKQFIIAVAVLAAGIAAQAATVVVSNNITSSVTWTSANTYELHDLVYVEPGATLTIEAGTKVIGLDPTEHGGTYSSALIVTRGAKIYANGTAADPIVFTSDEDTGSWRPVNGEWGNLTILGNAVIADGGATGGIQDGTCEDDMEGIPAGPLAKYGGNDDDDNSGAVSYVSLRFGGSKPGVANELNGLSLGGIGRATDMHHIDIMNNLDDGIEIWGGTVGMKYLSIWNIGDDSLDLDEGYRGKIQFGLIVQGLSDPSGSQESGIGDNCIEADGGENPDDMQPYANPQMFNLTVIGEPTIGDTGAEFRDNFFAQIHNSIFMDIGDKAMRFNKDFIPEMSNGFHTAHNVYTSAGYDVGVFPEPCLLYSDSRSGFWSQFKDCVFYNNNASGTYTTLSNLNQFAAGNFNSIVVDQPIATINRGLALGGMDLVVFLDPCASNSAVSAVNKAPADGFFTPAPYAGAFSETGNWLLGWTAADEMGFTADTGKGVAGPASSIAAESVVQSTVSFASVAGVSYTVEGSNDMSSWVEVATVKGTGSTMEVTDRSGDDVQFYRVVVR